MKQKLIIFSFIALMSIVIFGLISCEKPALKSSITSINKLNIADAKVLYTTELSLAKAQTSASLFKITADNKTSEVIVKDQDGNPIIMESCMIKNINPDLINLLIYINPNIYEYIVRKSDGAVFVVPTELSQQLRNHTCIDGDNNIYTLGHGKTWDQSSIYKISSNLSNGLNAQKLTSEYWVTFSFLSDHSGNLLFNILNDKIILRTTNGNYCLSDININCNKLFTLKGQNGFFYFEGTKLYSFKPNESLAKIEKIEVTEYSQDMSCGDIFEVIYNQDKTIIICNAGICIIRDQNNVKMTGSQIDRYQHGDMQVVSKYYYWNDKPGYAINNKILRFDVENEIIENVFYNENYTVESFTGDIDGGITFKGMNLMSGRKIKGTVVDGVFSEIPLTSDDELEPKVINFIQL